MKRKIAGVIVLYHPDEHFLDNVRTYYHSLDKLYVVDNSESPSVASSKLTASGFKNIEYIPLGQNLGIAKALNIAAEKALEEGFEWLLTMDQDSKASEGMVEALLESVLKTDKDKVGIAAPRYLLEGEPEQHKEGIEDVFVTITSGNLLNLKAYARTGPFREDLFIDYVDHEYCLRLRRNNYRIIINNDTLLYHELGHGKFHSLLGRRIGTTNHNYIRRYYITRNRLTVLKEYKNLFPDYYKAEKNNNLKEVVKLVLLEKDKLRKLRSFVRGYLDFKHNKFGKYRS